MPSVLWGKVQKQKASYCKSREGRMQWSGEVVRRGGGQEERWAQARLTGRL